MKKSVFVPSLALLLTAVPLPASAADLVEADATATVVRTIPLAELRLMPRVFEAQTNLLARKPAVPLGPLAVDPLAIYSNISTFGGTAFAHGPSELQTGNQITRLAADDVTFTTNAGVSNVTTIRFTVANLNATSVSARPRVRIYNSDGAGGAPGTYVAGYSFNAVTFASGVTTLTGNVGGFAVPPGATTTYWAGLTFDNNTGATGATAAQMDNLGQGIYGPVDLGSSVDRFFETTAAGSFLVNSPAGSILSFSGSPVAHFGWEFVVTTLPVSLQGFRAE